MTAPGQPLVSVVIPVFDGADTIERALDSLLAQSYTTWEAFIVDDGSRDETVRIAETYVARDPRLTLIRCEVNVGVGAARDLAIAVARGPWLFFLDADDWIHARALERLTDAVLRDPQLDAVHCGWALVARDGRVIEEGHCAATGDLFPLLARRNAFTIHACLVRHELIDAIGAFDHQVRVARDWLLWQRVARAGARFGRVSETLAYYLQRAGSLSSDPAVVFGEAMTIIEQGHGPDPVVAGGPHAAGQPRYELPGARLDYLCWIAGMMVARGLDPSRFLDRIEPGVAQIHPAYATESIARALPAALGRTAEVWEEYWPRAAPLLGRFFEALEAHVLAPGLGRSLDVALARRLLESGALTAPRTIGTLHATPIEVTRAIDDVRLPAGIERLLALVSVDGERLGAVELPVCDGVVRADVLRDAIADRFAWRLLGRFFERGPYARVELRREADGWAAWLEGARIAGALPDAPRARLDALHDAIGWSIFVNELWGASAQRHGWRAGLERRLAQPLAAVRSTFGRAQRLADDDWIVADAAEPCPAIRPSSAPTRVALHIAGGAVGVFELERDTSADSLRGRLTDDGGFELCRVAVRETLVGFPWDGSRPLHACMAERAFAARRATANGLQLTMRVPSEASIAPGWERAVAALAPADARAIVVARRARPASLARFAALPAALAESVREVESRAGTPIIDAARTARDDEAPELVLHAPSVLWSARRPTRGGAAGISAEAAARHSTRHDFEALFARAADPWRYTSAYERRKYDETLAMIPNEPIGRALELACAEGHFSERLAERVGELLATDIADGAVARAAARCRALGNVRVERLDLANDPVPGPFDLIVCSEVLYYVGDSAELARVAERIAGALTPGGVFVTAHANVLSDDPDRTGYDWSVPFGARTIIETFAAVPSLRLERELRTPLYRIARFRAHDGRAPAPAEIREIDEIELPVPEVAAHIVPGGRRDAPPASSSPPARLPILMYHHVAPDDWPGVAPGRAPWRVAPDDFEEQLRYLRDCGFTSVGLSTWRDAIEHRRALPDRPVLFTFDDGYDDFARFAWPLLRRYGFGALLLVVPGNVGGQSAWGDGADGEPLLDWDALARLRDEGVTIGAHSMSHRRLSAMAPTDMAREALDARAAIERRLDITVDTFAYPYGDEDEVVRHIVGAAGFSYGLSTRAGLAMPADPWLALPRVEVLGSAGRREFIAGLAP